MSENAAHALYVLAWISFGLGHSFLAGGSAKLFFTSFLGPYYRLSYNLFAVLHIALVMSAGWYLFNESDGFVLENWARSAQSIVYAFGWGAFLYALLGYDLGLLAGTKQIRNHLRGQLGSEYEPLQTGGLHRFVRHPLYFGAFMILWGRVANDFDLVTAAWASLYLVVGAYFEERRLLRQYGKDYADYRTRVPAFIPWRGRAF